MDLHLFDRGGMGKGGGVVAVHASSPLASRRHSLRPVLAVAIASALVLGVATVFKSQFYFVFPREVYLPLHALAEIASVVVSFSIFAVNWNAADKARDQRALLIGTAFLAVAIIDAMHALSFPGMPDFVTQSSTEKGIQYWLSGRLWAALALLAAGLIRDPAGTRFLRRGPLLAMNLTVAFLVFAAVSFFPDRLPPLYVDGQGLTTLKVGLEYLVAALSALAALVYVKSYAASGNHFFRLLAMALVVTVFSEMAFTLYAGAYDTYNVLGHVYKVVAYYFIFSALFVSAVQRPYFELEKLYDEIDNQLKRTISELQIRAADLNAANHELEAFSYSVSHDLKAPLRAIDGFSHALLEDYGDRLDATGQGYLQRVFTATGRMSLLIDGLLDLSRLSRNEIRREPLDLSEMAREVAAGLRSAQPEREMKFVCADGVTAEGDPQLLRVVLENLLGNAWKFTAKRPKATIHFGVTEEGGKKAYFVRDDGAGFDATYADKLFVPFQRLHGSKEFPGTGIGLATVMRIVRRHGGRIWAEGAVEQGATFYFTLQEPIR